MAPRQPLDIEQWQRFFDFCLRRNLDLKSFREALQVQSSKYPLNGVGVIKAWASHPDKGLAIRPRYLKYFEQLLHSHIITDEDGLVYVLRDFKDTIAGQGLLLVESGSAKGEHRPTIEAAILERLAYQMVNFRVATVPPGDRMPSMRAFKPLIQLLSATSEVLAGSTPLTGPVLEIANELGKFVIAYINDLSLLGLLTYDNGGPPKGIFHSGVSSPQLLT